MKSLEATCSLLALPAQLSLENILAYNLVSILVMKVDRII